MRRDADSTNRSFNDLDRTVRRTGDSFHKLGGNIATVDNELRGLGIFAVVLGFQQLITAAASLGGQMVALASSAALAGAALGGALISGVGQAIPAIGLLSAALVRVKAVTDAVGQAQKAQQATAVQGNQVANQTRDAADRVRTAQEGVANATRRVGEAQESLREARRQGVRELQDLINAEREAELAARGAVLGQKEAQEALRKAIQEGRTGDVQRAELGVDEAAANRRESRLRLQRAREDASRARGGGVEGLASVRNATRSVQEAQRALVSSRRQVSAARQDATDTGKAALAAAETLNFMLQQLSPAERRLFNSFQRIQATFKRNIRPITDIIITAFADTTDRFTELLDDKRILAPLRRLATSIGESIGALTSAFTNNQSVELFGSLTDNAAKNIERLTPGVIAFGRALENIAGAGQGALSRIVGISVDIAQGFERLTSDQGRLAEIFDFGTDRLEEWLRLVGAVARLTAAIIAPGGDLSKGAAASGGRTVVAATEAINKLADQINEHAEDVDRFFRNTEEGTRIILDLLIDIGRTFATAFDIDHLRNLAKFLQVVLIPVLGNLLEIIGKFTSAFAQVLSDDRVAPFARMVIQVTLLAATIAKLQTAGSFFKNVLFAGVGTLIAPLRRVAGFLGAISERALGARSAVTRFFLALAGAGAAGRRGGAGAAEAALVPGHSPARPLWVRIVGQQFTGAPGSSSTGRGTVVAPIPSGGAGRGGGVLGRLLGGLGGLGRLFAGGALLSGGIGALATPGNAFERLQGGLSSASFGLIPGPTRRQSASEREIAGAQRRIGRAIDAGDPETIAKTVKQVKALADEFERFDDDKTARKLNEIAKRAEDVAPKVGNVKEAVRDVRDAFDWLRDGASQDWPHIESAVSLATTRIKRRMSLDSDAGKEAMALNFRLATQAVRRSMHNQQISVREGLSALRKLMASSLKNLGFTDAQSRIYMRGRDPETGQRNFPREDIESGRPFALGGWIGNAGERGKDAIHAILGRGEAVLNWGQQKLVEPALRATYGIGLDELFKKTKGFHAGSGQAGGFAKGGRAEGSHLQRLLSAANKVNAAEFPYHWGGGHEQPANFEPFDCSGAVSYVVQQAGYKVPTTTSGQIGSDWGFPGGSGGVTVFYNPTHTFMRIGSRYFGTSGFARPNGGAGWFDRTPSKEYLSNFQTVHLPDIGRVGAFIGDGMDRVRLPRVKAKGVRGELGKIAQKALDSYRRALQHRLDSADVGVGGDAGSGQSGEGRTTAGGQYDKADLRKLWVQAGGPPGVANLMAAIALAESSGNPNAHNPSGATGLWQILGNPFPGNAYDPITNARMAVSKYRSQGLGAWEAYTRGMHKRFLAGGGFMPEFARGGIVPGGEGHPRPILAHSGEWVLNKLQQSRIAQLAGTTRDRLKEMLGFTGGPNSMQGGGEVRGGSLQNVLGFVDPKQVGVAGTELRKRMEQILKGVYELPLDALRSVEDITTEMRRAFRAIGNIGRRDKDRFKHFSDNLDAFTGEGGLLDQLATQTEQLGNRLATKTMRGAVAAIKGAALIIDGRSQALLRSTRSETRQIEVELKNLAEVSSALYGQRSGIRRASRQSLNALKDVNREIRRLERGGISNDEKKEYERLLKERRRVVTGRENLRQRLDDIDEAIAQNINDRLERQRDLFEAQTKQAVTGSSVGVGGRRSRVGPELVLRALDSIQSVTEAFGRQTAESIENIGRQRLNALRNQQAILEQRRDEAVRRGFTDIADGLQEQIEDISQQIAEGTAALLNDVIQATTDNFERGRGRLDLSGRIADAVGKVGLNSVIPGVGSLGATTRAGLFGARDQSFRGEINALVPLIARAQAEGNVGAFNTLSDRINELNVSILENSEALRQARIEAVNRPVQLQNALTGTFSQIFELQRKLGLISSEDQRSQTRDSLDRLGSALATQATQLQDLLNEANITGNESAQQDLTQQMAENTLAQLQNTDAIKTLEGAINVQNFTSSFWTGFRNALFTGEGALVPRFSTPVSTFGSSAMWPGSLPSGSMLSSASNSTIVNFDIDRAGDPIDANEIVSKVLFASGSRDR